MVAKVRRSRARPLRGASTAGTGPTAADCATPSTRRIGCSGSGPPQPQQYRAARQQVERDRRAVASSKRRQQHRGHRASRYPQSIATPSSTRIAHDSFSRSSAGAAIVGKSRREFAHVAQLVEPRREQRAATAQDQDPRAGSSRTLAVIVRPERLHCLHLKVSCLPYIMRQSLHGSVRAYKGVADAELSGMAAAPAMMASAGGRVGTAAARPVRYGAAPARTPHWI